MKAVGQDSSIQAPKEFLADYQTLLKRLNDTDSRIEKAGGPIEVTNQQLRSAKRLNSLRRDFTHFSPKGWSIELSGMPQIVSDVAATINKIANDPWPFRHISKTRKLYLERLIRKVSALGTKWI